MYFFNKNVSISLFKNGEKFASQKVKFWSADWEFFAKMRPQNSSPALGLVYQNLLQIVPKNGLLICTSNLQVHCHLQVQFTSEIHKCD